MFDFIWNAISAFLRWMFNDSAVLSYDKSTVEYRNLGVSLSARLGF